MAYDATDWAHAQRPNSGKAVDIAVLREIAHRVDRTSFVCRLKLLTIAESIGFGRSSVNEAVTRLISDDLIEMDTRRRQGHQAANEFRVNHPKAPHMLSRVQELDSGDAETGIERTPTTRRRKVAQSPAPGLGRVQELDSGNFPNSEAVTCGDTTNPQDIPESTSWTPEQENKVFNEQGGTRSVRKVTTTREAGATDGRTETSPRTRKKRPPAVAEADPADDAAALVAAAALQADFARIDLKPSQRRQLIAEVSRALLRFAPDQVAAYLAERAREARTATFLLKAFIEYADTITLTPVPFRRADFRDEASFLAAMAEVQAAAEYLNPPAAPDHPESRPNLPLEPPARSEGATTRPRPICALCGDSGGVLGDDGEKLTKCGCATKPDEHALVVASRTDKPGDRGLPTLREQFEQYEQLKAQRQVG